MDKKNCAACADTKPVSEFFRDPRRKDGLHASCKACHSARVRRWYEAHTSEKRQIQRDYRAANPGLYRDYARVARAKHPERFRQYGRRHRDRHRDEINERTRLWFKDNPARACAYVRARDAKKLRQTIPHSKEATDAIYERARLLSEITGVPHHVDHIVPRYYTSRTHLVG